MARTDLTKTQSPGGYSGTGIKLTFAAADTSNKNKFTARGCDIVVAKNTDSSAHTVTITSVDDKYGRQEDITEYSVPAGETHIFGPFPMHGWMQSDGSIYLEADNTNIEFGIIQWR